MIVKLIAMWLNRKKRRLLERKLSKEIALLEKAKRPFRRRLYRRRPNYSDSNWAFLLAAGKCKNPLTREGKLFRRRFRVSYPIYEEIVRIVRDRKWFNEFDGIGQPSAPLELKILGVLRILGRGMCFDGISELTNIGEEAIRVFFHRFNEKFAEELFPVYCNPPETEEDISGVMEVYRRLGLPGCIGSTGCVHIRWDSCPAEEKTTHKGKEGFCTLSYEVTVSHNKRITSCTKGFKGATNDKTIGKPVFKFK